MFLVFFMELFYADQEQSSIKVKEEKKGQKLSLLNVSGQPHKLMSLLRVDKTIPFIEQADIA